MTNGETRMDDPSGVSGSMGLSINLPDNVRITSRGTAPTGDGSATGTVVAFAGDDAPAGWLLCDGAAVSRSTYSELFALVSTKYGVGNGSTTFNLPDLRGRFPLGRDNMGNTGDRSANRVLATTAEAVGRSGGAETHTLTTDELPAHHHGPEKPADHVRGPFTGYWMSAEAGQWELEHHTVISGGPRIDVLRRTADAGGDQAHNNMPPYQTLNYIIKT